MSIWVRSQQKGVLVETDSFDIADGAVYCNSVKGKHRNSLSGYRLGSYIDYRRTKEVLDDIQQFIVSSQSNDVFKNLVYEMPNE
jgi:hypothetical protein